MPAVWGTVPTQFSPTLFTFFSLKNTKLFFENTQSTGESCKILDAHTNRTQCRRDCPSNLETRNTETHAHLHTHMHAHPHTGLNSRCDTSVAMDGRLAGSLAAARATAEPLARSKEKNFLKNTKQRQKRERQSKQKTCVADASSLNGWMSLSVKQQLYSWLSRPLGKPSAGQLPIIY